MSIQALVDRGLEIRAEVKKLKKELDDIEDKLAKAGLASEQQELKDADREGRRWLARGSELVVPVVFTADKLMGSFKANSATHQQIKTIAGDYFGEFWRLNPVYEIKFEDGKRFRSEADKLLGPRAPGFITACLARDKFGMPKSDVKVVWDDAMDKESAC